MSELREERRAPDEVVRESNPGAETLVLDRELPGSEIVHFAEDDLLIASRHRTIVVETGGLRREIVLPESLPRRLLGLSRLARRALRLDKANVTPAGPDRSELVILRGGQAYHYDIPNARLTPTLAMRNCRNVLHGAVTVLDENEVVFGEYGPSGSVATVPIYRSTDAGRSWTSVYEFAPGSVRHVHGCYWDPFEQRYWIFTGDADHEIRVLSADRSFSEVRPIGGGSQKWRACTAFFEENYVYWIMDSEREDSHLIRFDRNTRQIETGQLFPGPVWYTKRTSDGLYLAATSCETGAGVHDDFAHIFVSRNLEDWHEVARFAWDGLPKGWFKMGVVSFAEGEQGSGHFYLFGEALKGIDGRSFQCRIAAGS